MCCACGNAGITTDIIVDHEKAVCVNKDMFLYGAVLALSIPPGGASLYSTIIFLILRHIRCKVLIHPLF